MSLEKIGQLAVDLHAATLARKSAKLELREKYTAFCRGRLSMSGATYIAKDHPQYGAMQEYAKPQVEAYARAKLDEFNVKRRLNRAITAMARAEQQEQARDSRQIDMDEAWHAEPGSVSGGAAVE